MQLSTRLLTISLLLVTVSGLGAETIRFTGSDLLEDTLKPTFLRYSSESGNKVAENMLGTLPALNAMQDGNSDIAVIAIPADQDLPEDRYRLVPFAYRVAYIILNAENPVAELSLPQLAGMFSTTPIDRIDRWGQLGITNMVSSRSVQLVVEEDPDGITDELFKYVALQSGSIRANTTYVNSVRSVGDFVAADLGAIGVASGETTAKSTKAIAVSSGESGSFAFGPTPENVYYGDYLLRLPFYIAVPRGSTDADIRSLMKALLSEETAAELTKAGFMPLPENVRKRTIQELDR